MADTLVRHALNPSKVVKFSVDVRQVHDVTHDPTEVPLIDYPRVEGDVIWVVRVATTEPDINGDPIPLRILHLASLANLNSLVQDAINEMCKVINWGDLQLDREGPFVYWYSPNDGSIEPGHYVTASGVYIGSDVYIKLKENLPATGIDLSTVEMYVTISGTDPTKDFGPTVDVSSEIELTGTPYDLQIYWEPTYTVYEQY